ncbi:MAG: terminase [Candidatus Fimenecus sp.]
MKLSQKYLDFLQSSAKLEVLEGTTFAGKTTVGVLKFMLRVAESEKKFHVLSGLDLGTIEKNIVNADLGICDIFGASVIYKASGGGNISLPHIVFRPTKATEKIIYVLGYDNKARWKKALGGQYGCVYIDEANIADMEFVREISIRYDYMLMTLNPDAPDLPIYAEYINHTRPLTRWRSGTPAELLAQLNEEPKAGFVHWYFTFDDNAGLTAEKREQLLTGTPKNSKLYKNKILGLRGRATGLVFDLQEKNIITEDEARKFDFVLFSCGVDTSYSSKSPDKIAFIFTGFTKCRKKITLDCAVYNNKDRKTPLTPSDIPPLLTDFLDYNSEKWGLARNVFIDSADQGTILECQKYKRAHGLLYQFQGAWKKLTVLNRIKLQSGWMAHGDYLIVGENCKDNIDELNIYSWQEEKDEPEDGNDHTINADQYSWLPFKDKIGSVTEK